MLAGPSIGQPWNAAAATTATAAAGGGYGGQPPTARGNGNGSGQGVEPAIGSGGGDRWPIPPGIDGEANADALSDLAGRIESGFDCVEHCLTDEGDISKLPATCDVLRVDVGTALAVLNTRLTRSNDFVRRLLSALDTFTSTGYAQAGYLVDISEGAKHTVARFIEEFSDHPPSVVLNYGGARHMDVEVAPPGLGNHIGQQQHTTQQVLLTTQSAETLTSERILLPPLHSLLPMVAARDVAHGLMLNRFKRAFGDLVCTQSSKGSTSERAQAASGSSHAGTGHDECDGGVCTDVQVWRIQTGGKTLIMLSDVLLLVSPGLGALRAGTTLMGQFYNAPECKPTTLIGRKELMQALELSLVGSGISPTAYISDKSTAKVKAVSVDSLHAIFVWMCKKACGMITHIPNLWGIVSQDVEGCITHLVSSIQDAPAVARTLPPIEQDA
jgi:hypothetical protein